MSRAHRASNPHDNLDRRHDDAVVVTDVRKSYGPVTALDGVSVRMARGAITALLGPNGAGKTTLMEILSGIRRPDSGTARVLGLDPAGDRRRLAERLGVQVQEFNLQSTVTVIEALTFFASLHSSPTDVGVLLDRFGLTDKAKSRFPRLSGGQKRRLAIAKALVGDPDMVILDEPTSGLDPQGQEFLRTETRRLRSEGRTILLSTHDVGDAEELADTVVIVDHGSVVACGRPEAIIAQHCLGWRTVVEATLPSCATVGVEHVRLDQPERTVLYTADETSARMVLSQVGQPSGVPGRPATLHDAFIILTGTGLRS